MESASENLPSTGRSCRNCGTPLSGDYCGACGQRDRDLRLADIAGEALEDVTDLDSRLWVTLKTLVLRPGHITADYIDGRRARYLPPVRLYLVVSFLVFLSLPFTEGPAVNTVGVDQQVVEDLDAGIYIPRTNAAGEQEFLTIDEFIEQEGLSDEIEELPTWLQSALERMIVNAERIQENPDAFLDGLVRRLPQMMFFLLPVFALMVWLFYAGSSYHYLQHLVFSVHYHTVAFLAFLLMQPLNLLMPADYGGVVTLALMIYLPFALRGAYASSKKAAAVKGMVLAVSYYFVVVLTGTLVALMTLAFL
jgi:hypothetical protein